MNATQHTTANLLICASNRKLKPPSPLLRLRGREGRGLATVELDLDLRRAIFRFHLDADALKKGGRQNPAGAHDDRVVPDLHSPPLLLDLDVVATDLLDIGLKQDGEATGLPRSFHLLAILHLSARKRIASVGKSDRGARLLG